MRGLMCLFLLGACTEKNTDTAAALGIHVWNINPAKEDVSSLLNRKEFQ